MTKNEIMLAYLQQCEGVQQLYLNYGDARAGNALISTVATESASQAAYVDGSAPKQLDYSLVWYKPISVLPVRNPATGQYNPVLAELDDVQSIIDWIEAQNDAHSLPDFGEDCPVDSIRCLQSVPQLLGIDTTYSPALARYTFTVRVEYTDFTRCIYR